MSKRQSWYEINRGNPAVAEVYLHDEIGLFGVSSQMFVDELRTVTAPTLKLHVNSPGGSVDDGIAIYNALMSHPAKVEVYVDALAASIATVIAMAGEKRVMAPHSRMMIHEAMALGMGYAGDFEKLAARLRDCTTNIAGIYADHTGKDASHWLPLMADETWFTDQEAVDQGLATEIGRDYAPENFARARSFAMLNHFQGKPEFDVEEASEADAADDDFTPEERAALRALLTGKVADEAPEGDPEPSLSPIEARRKAVDELIAGIR